MLCCTELWIKHTSTYIRDRRNGLVISSHPEASQGFHFMIYNPFQSAHLGCRMGVMKHMCDFLSISNSVTLDFHLKIWNSIFADTLGDMRVSYRARSRAAVVQPYMSPPRQGLHVEADSPSTPSCWTSQPRPREKHNSQMLPVQPCEGLGRCSYTLFPQGVEITLRMLTFTIHQKPQPKAASLYHE